MDSQVEQNIARGLREGRTDAWEALYDAYARTIWQAVARQMGPDVAEVSDVVQETFLAAARSARQYDPARGSLGQWLSGIARRHVALHYRQRERYERRLQSDDSPATGDGRATDWLASGEPPPSDAAVRHELAGMVRSALGRLPEDYETLLRAKYFDGVSVEVLAALEASTESAVRSKLARARRAFREVFLTRSCSRDPIV